MVSRIESPVATPTCSLICLKRSMSMHEHGRPHVGLEPGEDQRRLQPIEEQFAVGQAGQIVVDGVVQQPLLRIALRR